MTEKCDITCTAKTLKAISHPLRLKILCCLNDGELSVKEIVEKSGASQSNISQHLSFLRSRGILDARRDATRVYYRIAKLELIDIIKMMQELYCQHEAA
ncbi:MAG: winged helix-turn-helix transcriptional regulator [Sulfuriflexus sp.]|nr:winged helix-turn-helix transcriptional regulator [Sulfuriflexus sp.]